MNIPLLRKIQKFLLAEPRRFDMGAWIDEAAYADVLKPPPCGTALCIAGAAYVIEEKIKLNDTNVSPAVVETFATQALDINDSQASRLYCTVEWPQDLREKYYDATTPRQRALVGAARIARFIKTKGEE